MDIDEFRNARIKKVVSADLTIRNLASLFGMPSSVVAKVDQRSIDFTFRWI